MFNKLAHRENSLFYTFFISYITILVITIVLGSMSYLSSASVLKNEMESYNMAMLQQAQQVIDERLLSVEQLILEISLNLRIQKFLYSGYYEDGVDIYDLAKVQEEIYNYSRINSMVDMLFVYYKNLDIIISDTSKYEPGFFYNQVVPYSEWKYEQWKEMLSKGYFKEYKPAQTIGTNIYRSNAITLFTSLPYGNKKQPLGNLVILLKEDKIASLLDDINILGKGTVYVLDSKDQVITSIGDKSMMKPFSYNSFKGRSYFYDMINGKETIVSFIDSKISDWKYISVIPTSAFSNRIRNIKVTAIIIILLELIIGTVVALLFSRRNYLPIKRIMERLRENIKGIDSISNVTNQIDFIEKVTAMTIRENNKIREIVNQMQPVYYTNLMIQLMKGFYKGNANIQPLLASAGVFFKNRDFCVFLVNIDDCASFVKDDSINEYGLVKLVIGNVFTELINKTGNVYCVDMEWDVLALIVNFNSEHEGNHPGLLSIAHYGHQVVLDHFSILVSIGIGNTYTGHDGINRSYQEASKALEYKLVKGAGSVITYEDISNVQQSYNYPFDMEMKLSNSIKSGDIGSVYQVLDEVYGKNFKETRQSLELSRCLFFNMISTAIKVINELNIDFERAFPTGSHPFKMLIGCKTVSEMYETLKEVYNILCAYINRNKKSHNAELKDRILEFIENNYENYNFSLSTIAEAFKINNNYLSCFFKEQIGENFIGYLNKMRVLKTKALLVNTDLTLDNIAQRLGYANSRVLIRVFKKFEGMTPGEYRRIQSKKQLVL